MKDFLKGYKTHIYAGIVLLLGILQYMGKVDVVALIQSIVAVSEESAVLIAIITNAVNISLLRKVTDSPSGI